MAKKKVKKDKNGHSVLGLDFEAIRTKYFEKKGVILTKGLMSIETSRTMVTIKNYEKELPPPVTFIANLMKELDMTFDELTTNIYE